MKHELLAPAGNPEAGYAALYYGADAVYLGLTKFSARAGAENFTPDELDAFCAYAHTLKRKVYVALNTILREDEIDTLPEVFRVLAKCRVDALIIQDLGVFYLAKKLLPEIELHASTQMAVHNAEGAKFLQSLGFKRVVLARELTASEIKAVAAAAPKLELEVFVHGALCYSYSGQCLFSALEYGKSANRGRCAYPCRSLYERKSVQESGQNAGENPGFSLPEGHEKAVKEHLFSMKDLALEEDVLNIPALSLKIEGRKKSPLYVAAVTNYYRHILDGKKKKAVEAEDIRQIFSRPWCRFFFNGRDKSVVDPLFVGHRGLVIGKAESIKRGRLGFVTTHKIGRYDGLQLDVPGDEKPFGFGIKALYLKNKPVFEADAGAFVEVELPKERPSLSLGTPIYLASSSEVKGRYDYTKPKAGAYANREELEVRVEITPDAVWAMSLNAAVSLEGDFKPADDVNKVAAAAEGAFNKTGGTAFCLKKLEVVNIKGLFVPVSLFNELRRRLIAALEKEENCCTQRFDLPEILPLSLPSNKKPFKINPFYAGLEISDEEITGVAWDKVWVVLPQICRNTARLKEVIVRLYQAGARQFVAENYYAFYLLADYKDVKCAAGSFIYVMNRYAAAALAEIGAAWGTLALESSAENMEQTIKRANLPLVQVVRCFPPLFTSAVCIRKNACKDCSGGIKEYLLQNNGRTYRAVSKGCEVQVFSQKVYEREVVPGVYGIADGAFL